MKQIEVINLPKELSNKLELLLNSLNSKFIQHDYEGFMKEAGFVSELFVRIQEFQSSEAYTKLSGNTPTINAPWLSKYENDIRLSDFNRFLFPRAIFLLQTFRNKRGGGHLTDEESVFLEADVIFINRLVKWCLAEMLRQSTGSDKDDILNEVESLNYSNLPLVWEVNGKIRVLEELTFTDKVLVILASKNKLTVNEILESIEYSSKSLLKTRILKPLHKRRYIEFDDELDTCQISPTGYKKIDEVLSVLRVKKS